MRRYYVREKPLPPSFASYLGRKPDHRRPGGRSFLRLAVLRRALGPPLVKYMIYMGWLIEIP